MLARKLPNREATLGVILTSTALLMGCASTPTREDRRVDDPGTSGGENDSRTSGGQTAALTASPMGIILAGQSNARHLTAGEVLGDPWVKSFEGGTNLSDDWDPLEPGPNWQSMIDAWNESQGEVLHAFIWVQGEKDARNEGQAQEYRENLELLLQQIHAQLPTAPNFVLVVALLPSWQSQRFNAEVRAAQEAFAAAHTDEVITVNGDDLTSRPDGLHYDADGAAALTERIDEAVRSRDLEAPDVS